MSQSRFFKDEPAVFEVWDSNDPRLPVEVDRPMVKDFQNFCENFSWGQIEPIVMCQIGKKFYLAAGRKRLLAARKLKVNIEVKVVKVRSEEDVTRIRASENHFRSANEAADILAMRSMLFNGRTYEQIAESQVLPGFTAQQIKQMDNAWSNVPVEIIDGCIDGNISTSTAKEIGKIKNKASQNRIVKVYGKNGRLSMSDVKEERSAIKGEATATLNWVVPNSGRMTFDRSELTAIQNLLKAGSFEEAHNFVDFLLNQ